MSRPARFDLVVPNGTVVTETGSFAADIGVRDGRIAALAERLEDGSALIDARGRLVLPGGVDGHCHMDQPSYAGTACATDWMVGWMA